MALCRCYKHAPTGRKNTYNYYALPIGFRNTSSICGTNGCNDSGLIWLTNRHDLPSFNRGNRIFGLTTHNGTKMKIQNKIYPSNIKPK